MFIKQPSNDITARSCMNRASFTFRGGLWPRWVSFFIFLSITADSSPCSGLWPRLDFFFLTCCLFRYRLSPAPSSFLCARKETNQRNVPNRPALSGCPPSARLWRVGQTELPVPADLNRPSWPIPPRRRAPLGGLKGSPNTSRIEADGVKSDSESVPYPPL